MEQGTTSGSIPSELGNLSNLNFIDFDFNFLTGTLPPELYQLTGMFRLDGECPFLYFQLVHVILPFLHVPLRRSGGIRSERQFFGWHYRHTYWEPSQFGLVSDPEQWVFGLCAVGDRKLESSHDFHVA
jgi:hypothetical protein